MACEARKPERFFAANGVRENGKHREADERSRERPLGQQTACEKTPCLSPLHPVGGCGEAALSSIAARVAQVTTAINSHGDPFDQGS